MILPENEQELEIAVKLFKHMNNHRDPYARVLQLQAYLKKWNINKVVVGVSGGVDSALVLAMLSKIRDIEVHAVCIKYDVYHRVFDDSYVRDLQKAFPTAVWHIHDHSSLAEPWFSPENFSFQSFETQKAQVTYAMRYLAFFFYAQYLGGIVVGTTNFDEFGYAGWFGKHSDMMVDVQPIADLHKFEVRSWAEILGVPERIVQRVPTGDLIDNSSDEANFGCTYDELSYITDLIVRKKQTPNAWLSTRFEQLSKLRAKNAHKYQAGQGFNPIFLG